MKSGCVILVVAAVATLLVSSCGASRRAADASARESKNSSPALTVHDAKVAEMIELGKSLVGVKYRYGGDDPSGFDCSGFICYVYGKSGFSLPRSSTAQYAETSRLGINEIRAGDLAFFEGSKHNGKIGHVAMILSVDGGSFDMIHATVSKGVVVDVYPDAGYYSSRLLGFGRVKGLE